MWSTFAELPYRELLSKLPDCLNTRGLFIVDMHHYKKYPSGEASREFEISLSDGQVLKISLHDKFIGKKRIRESVYRLGEEIITDRSEADILTESGYAELLGSYGFTLLVTYYNYARRPVADPKRAQMIFLLNKKAGPVT
jgi:hypothetical protein